MIADFKGLRDLTARPSRLAIDLPVRRLPNLLLRCELALRFFSNLAIGVGPPIYSPAASGASTIWTHVCRLSPGSLAAAAMMSVISLVTPIFLS